MRRFSVLSFLFSVGCGLGPDIHRDKVPGSKLGKEFGLKIRLD